MTEMSSIISDLRYHAGCPANPEQARKTLLDAAKGMEQLEAVIGEYRAAFRANMHRRAQPGENIDAEIDRVFAELDRKR